MKTEILPPTPMPTTSGHQGQTLPTLWRIDSSTGGLVLSLHPGQARAWQETARFTALLAGTQGGKTTFAPWWLMREIELTAAPEGGSNDYLAVTSTYDLFKLKFLPVMQEAFEEVLGIGRYWPSNRIIELSDPRTGKFWGKRADDRMWGRIILRAAMAGGGLESATARGAVLDEAGQSAYTRETWEAVRRRLSIFRGRALLPTTIYDLGWLKEAIYDRAQRVGTALEMPGDDEFAVHSFDSIENPTFSLEEFRAAQASMQGWRFDMMYRGRFTRPAGQIYDCFRDRPVSEGGHRLRPFPIPDEWHRVAGVDFGVVNTCIGLYAVEEDEDGYPTGRNILYRTYHAGSRNATEHVEKIRAIEPRLSLAVGGAASEDQWRQAYLWAGLPIYAPTITDVEVGIDRVYGATKQGQLLAFDTERTYLSQKAQYSRELDTRGDPTTKIKDKEKYHFLDQERYFASLMCGRHARLLPFEPRRHLIVGAAATLPVPPSLHRFAGLHYGDGVPCGFVLGAVEASGRVVTEAEYTAPGYSVSEFIKGLTRFLRERRISPGAFTTACNDDLFLPTRKGEVSGPAIVEAFRAAGFNCVKAGGDGVNEWSALTDWLSRGQLAINRVTCPQLALTLPLLVPSKDLPGSPDKRGPLTLSQALCNGLMTRPRPLAATVQAAGGKRTDYAAGVR